MTARPRAPLDGVLVLSLEQAVAAPLCTCRLADAGARVIKVERAEGDFARHYDHAARGESAYFVWLNRGKESLRADLKDPEDAALLHRILARADVFVQNLGPGAAARAGFGGAALHRRYPHLVICEIGGFGVAGEEGSRKAYDLLVQAESGLCSVTGGPEGPARVGVSVADIACGMNACTGILEGLHARARNGGRGSLLATSLFDGMAEWMSVPLAHYEHTGQPPRRPGLRHPSIHPYGAYPTRGGPALLIAVQNEREFAALCAEVLGRAELATEARFASNPARCAHAEELDRIIAAAFTSMDRARLLERLAAARIAYGELNGVDGLARHRALRRWPVATPAGTVQAVAHPLHAPWTEEPRGPMPALGADDRALRREFAGAPGAGGAGR